jgi:hypothetical protein
LFRECKETELFTIEGASIFPNEPFMKSNHDGKPTFSHLDLIEKYEIKSFFSNAKNKKPK